MSDDIVYVTDTASAPSKTPARARVWSPSQATAATAVGGLAAALVAFEAEVEDAPPARVVLADDSDAALAAMLVATKRGIEVEAMRAASEAATPNGRLIGQLAATYTGAR